MPVYPGKLVELQSFDATCKSRVRRQADATIKINPAEGGMCVALETSGAAFVAGAVLIIGLHDGDNSVSQ
ncbi:hypothetical protein NKH75_19115 [Mesorhizobium sp. M0984]|uniref:hypothetical protein n=1 Tax=Mesorhizobium sp. M0984 TaxID=2957041 RepID=UPI00333B0BAC